MRKTKQNKIKSSFNSSHTHELFISIVCALSWRACCIIFSGFEFMWRGASGEWWGTRWHGTALAWPNAQIIAGACKIY